MVRAINGVDSGQYYYEVEVLASSDNIHYRIGWSTRKADLQAPVGYDIHSYAYRDIDGIFLVNAYVDNLSDASLLSRFKSS